MMVNHSGLPEHINVFELRLVSRAEHMRLFEVLADDDAPAVKGTQEEGNTTLYSQIWIDGQHLDEPHFIDLPALIQSIYKEGWRDIFTCGCGIAGCAGIPDGIRVIHSGEFVRWEFRRPLSAGNLVDPALSEWEKTGISTHFIFNRPQMICAVREFLDAVRHLVSYLPHRFEWPVCGISVADVLRIDPSNAHNEIHREAGMPHVNKGAAPLLGAENDDS